MIEGLPVARSDILAGGTKILAVLRLPLQLNKPITELLFMVQEAHIF